jgi:hypothetical protein
VGAIEAPAGPGQHHGVASISLDEAGTHLRFNTLRVEVLERMVRGYEGRLDHRVMISFSRAFARNRRLRSGGALSNNRSELGGL